MDSQFLAVDFLILSHKEENKVAVTKPVIKPLENKVNEMKVKVKSNIENILDKMNEVRAGRKISDIGINDKYWEHHKEYQQLKANLNP